MQSRMHTFTGCESEPQFGEFVLVLDKNSFDEFGLVRKYCLEGGSSCETIK